jgi:hypothetical protein
VGAPFRESFHPSFDFSPLAGAEPVSAVLQVPPENGWTANFEAFYDLATFALAWPFA